MFSVTLLPTGLLQIYDNINNGFWHARSNAFWNRDIIQTPGNIRLLPDTLIILGSLALLLFMLKAMFNLKPTDIRSGQPF